MDAETQQCKTEDDSDKKAAEHDEDYVPSLQATVDGPWVICK